MISTVRLNKYFLDDGNPNWERYVGSFENAYPDEWKCHGMSEEEKADVPSERDILRFVDYAYAKKGFLKRGGGYRLSSSEGCPIFFGGLCGEPLFFASEQDAYNVKDIIGSFGISVQEVFR